MNRDANSKDRQSAGMPSHDRFLEWCAILPTGQLSQGEKGQLQDHLAVCASCREALEQYEFVIGNAIPALGPEPEDLHEDLSWSEERAEADLFARLALEEELGTDGIPDGQGHHLLRPARISISNCRSAWRNAWILSAAAVLLCIALGVSAYHVGMSRGAQMATVASSSDRITLQQQVRNATQERDALRAHIAEGDAIITQLRRTLVQQSAEISKLNQVEQRLVSDLRSRDVGGEQLLKERSELARKLETAEATVESLHTQLDSLEQQSSENRQRASALESKVSDLTRLLHDREIMLDQQQELLAHDRDIRELMGARDLYIAEVYDVARNAETQKPYGRVFFTKGKSLIFYAYDLDQEAGVKHASTFQAWGQRGQDRQQALNLGIFYVDNAAKKRWALRFDDPQMLAQIDAVFVTVEPSGGSHKPSGKPLLFAYLRVGANHP